MKIKKLWIAFLILLGLLVVNFTPPAYAGVGLEYLGPNPLRPQPISGEPNILGAGAIVGNTGNENATITFTLLADQDFNSQFTYSISDNNTILSPGTRENFALTFTFNPNTIPAEDYNAAIKIVASPTSASGTSGSASFDLAVAISADVLSSNYNGLDVTLTTATTIETMTSPSTASSPTPTLQTTALSTNALSTNSMSVDPNLLIGVGIGAVAILLAFVISNRRRKDVSKGSSGKPKMSTTKDCARCGAAIQSNDTFCDSCGAKQGE